MTEAVEHVGDDAAVKLRASLCDQAFVHRMILLTEPAR
jgi:hypothetical protein